MKKAGRFIANFLAVFIIVVLASVPVLYLFGYETCVVMSGSMEPAITTGSLCVIDRNSEYENISVGDVVAYDTGSMTVAHRAIGVTDEGVETKGDANESSDGISVTADNFVGTVRAYVPYVGYFFLFLQTVWGKAIIIAVVVLLLVAAFMPEKKKKPEIEEKPAEKGKQQELAEKDKQQELAEKDKQQELAEKDKQRGSAKEVKQPQEAGLARETVAGTGAASVAIAAADVQETADAEDTAPVVPAAAEAPVQEGIMEGEGAEEAEVSVKEAASEETAVSENAENMSTEQTLGTAAAEAEEAEAEQTEAEEAGAVSAEAAEKSEAKRAEAEAKEKSEAEQTEAKGAGAESAEAAEKSEAEESEQPAGKIAAAAVRPEDFAEESVAAGSTQSAAEERDISALPAESALEAVGMAGVAAKAEEKAKEKETAKRTPDVAALSASGSVYIESIESPDEMKKKSAPLRVSGRVKTGDIAVSLVLSAESAGVPDGELPVRAVISVSSGSGSTCYIRIAAEYDGGKLSALPGGFGSYWMAADDGYWYYMKPLGDGTSVPAFRHIHVPEQLGKTDTVIFYTVTAQAVSDKDFRPDFAAENPWGIAEDTAETAESGAAAENSKTTVTAETGKAADAAESIETGKAADVAELIGTGKAVDAAESIGAGEETEAAEAAAETGKTADASDASETVSASDQDDKTVEKADLFVLNYEESAQEILDGQDSLFTEVKSFVPGASYEDTLTIQANEITSLYFSGTALRPGSAYGNIMLTVTSEVRKRTRTRFCGPLSSDALKKGFTLTTLGIGETGKLTFTLQVPEDYQENTVAAPEQIEWHFTGALC